MTRHAATLRPSYRRALAWIGENDDTEWLEPDDGGQVIPSVTAALVTDLFGHPDDKIIHDLRREMKKAGIEIRRSLPRRGAAAARDQAFGLALRAPLPRPARTRGGEGVFNP